MTRVRHGTGVLDWLSWVMGLLLRNTLHCALGAWVANSRHGWIVVAETPSGVTMSDELLVDLVPRSQTKQVLLGVLQHSQKDLRCDGQCVHQLKRQPCLQSGSSHHSARGVSLMADLLETIQARVRRVQHCGTEGDDRHHLHHLHGSSIREL